MCSRQNYKQIAVELGTLYQEYREYIVDLEKRKEIREKGEYMEQLWQRVKGKLQIDMPELLLALLDVYEVTRDEEMLQEVLDVVSGNIGQLEVAEDSVKLLAYCYYYVEEEECIVKAREMLKELKQRGENATEAEKVLEELGNV